MTTQDRSLTDDEILIESFANPTHEWFSKNDPVMGGRSYSSVTIENKLAIFDGECVDVPFLHAPGFVTMETEGGEFPDVSSCKNLRLRLRSSVSYDGYRVSFGRAHVPGNRFAFGYKANLHVPMGPDIITVDIPFNEFTVRWDDKTGDPITTCAENKDFCPNLKTLQNMQMIQLWGEGVHGKVHLEVESIGASGCESPSIKVATTPSQSTNTNNNTNTNSVGYQTMTIFGALGLVLVASILFTIKKVTRGYKTVDDNEEDIHLPEIA